MRPPLFSVEDGRVYVDTPWPRATVFSAELLEAADYVRVEVDLQGVPVRVLIAVANGGADYEVLRFDDTTGALECQLKKCSRTPHRPVLAVKKKNSRGSVLGRHSSTGCYGTLHRDDLGQVWCDSCGWKERLDG